MRKPEHLRTDALPIELTGLHKKTPQQQQKNRKSVKERTIEIKEIGGTGRRGTGARGTGGRGTVTRERGTSRRRTCGKGTGGRGTNRRGTGGRGTNG